MVLASTSSRSRSFIPTILRLDDAVVCSSSDRVLVGDTCDSAILLGCFSPFIC